MDLNREDQKMDKYLPTHQHLNRDWPGPEREEISLLPDPLDLQDFCRFCGADQEMDPTGHSRCTGGCWKEL